MPSLPERNWKETREIRPIYFVVSSTPQPDLLRQNNLAVCSGTSFHPFRPGAYRHAPTVFNPSTIRDVRSHTVTHPPSHCNRNG